MTPSYGHQREAGTFCRGRTLADTTLGESWLGVQLDYVLIAESVTAPHPLALELA